MAQKSIYELTLDINANAAGLKTEAEKVRKSVNGMTDLTKNLAKFAAGFLTIGAAMEFTKKAIASTSGTADAFEKTIGGLKSATDKFFASVATGDFSNLIDGLKKAREAGEQYIASLDQIEERTLGLKLQKSKSAPEQAARMEIFKDKNADPTERQKKFNEYKTQAIKDAKTELAIASARVVAETDLIKGQGIEAGLIKELYTNYNDNLETINKVGDAIERGKEIQKQMNAEASKTLPGAKKINELGQQLQIIKNSLSDNEKIYFAALLSNDSTKQDNIDKYINSLIAENQAKAAIKMVDVDNLKIQNAITKEIKEQNNELDIQAKIKSMESAKKRPVFIPSISQLSIGSFGTKYNAPGLVSTNQSAEGIAAQSKYNQEIESAIALTEKQEEAAYSAADAIYNLTNMFGDMAASGKVSMKELVSATLSGIRQILVAKLAESLANTVSNALSPNPQNIVTGGLWGLATAAAGITAVTALWGKIPAFASGTNYAPGGLSLVGERGPELINLPRGSQVYSNTQTNNMLRGGEVVFRIQGTELVGILNKQNKIAYA